MKRSVLLTIDDERVDAAALKLRWPSYIHTDGRVLDYEHRWVDVPVPPDDQLTRALDKVTRDALEYYEDVLDDEVRNDLGAPDYTRQDIADAKLIRAALGLDEEGTDE